MDSAIICLLNQALSLAGIGRNHWSLGLFVYYLCNKLLVSMDVKDKGARVPCPRQAHMDAESTSVGGYVTYDV